MTYFTLEVLEVLKRNFYLSPETLHKIMNPYCGHCLAERGRRVMEKING